MLKKKKSYIVRPVCAASQTSWGGLTLLDALLRRFGTWTALDACTAATCPGYTTQSLAAQVLFTKVCGGRALTDASPIKNDPVLQTAIGLRNVAPPETLLRWLEDQTPESVAELRAVNSALVKGVLAEAAPERVCRSAGNSLQSVVYEEVNVLANGLNLTAPCWVNKHGNLMLLEYVLWLGPFMLETGIDTPGAGISDRLLLLQRYRSFWAEGNAQLHARSHSFEDIQIREAAAAGFAEYTMGCYGWRETLSAAAARIPEREWVGSVTRVPGLTESYAWLYAQIAGQGHPQIFAVARRPAPGLLGGGGPSHLYAFLAHGPGMSPDPQTVFAEFRAFGTSPLAVPSLASALGVHTPPCATQMGNNAFYTLCMLAYNAVTALKVLEMPDDAQGWRTEDIRNHIFLVPGKASKHAGQTSLFLDVPCETRLPWWIATCDRLFEKHKPSIRRKAKAAAPSDVPTEKKRRGRRPSKDLAAKGGQDQ